MVKVKVREKIEVYVGGAKAFSVLKGEISVPIEHSSVRCYMTRVNGEKRLVIKQVRKSKDELR